MRDQLLKKNLNEILSLMPWVEDYFSSHEIDLKFIPNNTIQNTTNRETPIPKTTIQQNPIKEIPLEDIPGYLGEDFFSDRGISGNIFLEGLFQFIDQVKSITGNEKNIVESLTILPGFNKDREKETFSIELKRGEVTAIVGPTGSGKSRLLEDIESLAQGDTPTKRKVLVNGKVPEDKERFSSEGHLIAQLSQNMNFVLDLNVTDFLTLHAESRMTENVSEVVANIFRTANILAGEPFSESAPVTELSGGQSRALMIADTALLSPAPIILIDEIENAGVDKVKALDILVSNNKIVLISTHDPLLALSADQRLVIKNGGIVKRIETSPEERDNLDKLIGIDRKLSEIRNNLRLGETIDIENILLS